MQFVSRSLCESGEEKSEYEFLQGLNDITGWDQMFRERKERIRERRDEERGKNLIF